MPAPVKIATFSAPRIHAASVAGPECTGTGRSGMETGPLPGYGTIRIWLICPRLYASRNAG